MFNYLNEVQTKKIRAAPAKVLTDSGLQKKMYTTRANDFVLLSKLTYRLENTIDTRELVDKVDYALKVPHLSKRPL